MVKKGFIMLVSFSLLNMSIFASSPLTRGKSVLVRITTTIDSKKGDAQNYNAVVDADVISNEGKILIKSGTPVELQIDAQKAKGCGRAGSISASCISTTSVDGQRISLNGTIGAEGANKKGAAIGTGVGLGLTFLPFIGFAFLAIKGGNAQIKANTVINNVFVANDYEIK